MIFNKSKAAQEEAVTTVSSVKALGEKFNEVTDGQTNVYATMVKTSIEQSLIRQQSKFL